MSFKKNRIPLCNQRSGPVDGCCSSGGGDPFVEGVFERLRDQCGRPSLSFRSCARFLCFDCYFSRALTFCLVFVDRVSALAVDACQLQYLTATRLCAMAPNAAACVESAKAARDQDIAIQKDEASAVAQKLQKRF
jgi:hypothetical protein